MNLVSCMGGWCNKRRECANYWAKSEVRSERLCEKGNDEPTPIADRRFDAWLAGATPEQVERWKRDRGEKPQEEVTR